MPCPLAFPVSDYINANTKTFSAPAAEPNENVIIDINVVFNKPARDFTSVEELRSFLNAADAKKLEVLDQLQGDIGRLNEDNEKHSEEIAKHQAAIRKNNDRQIKEISRTNEWESLFHVREKVNCHLYKMILTCTSA